MQNDARDLDNLLKFLRVPLFGKEESRSAGSSHGQKNSPAVVREVLGQIMLRTAGVEGPRGLLTPKGTEEEVVMLELRGRERHFYDELSKKATSLADSPSGGANSVHAFQVTAMMRMACNSLQLVMSEGGGFLG